MADRIAALRQVDSLAGLPARLLDALAANAGVQRIGKGSTLFREGEKAHFVYGLAEGAVALESGPAGEETIIDFIDKGDILLVPPALLRLPYMVTARAVSDLVVVLLPAEEFRRLAESEIALSAAINRLLSAHWRFLLRHLTHARTQDADTRLASYLMELAGHSRGHTQVSLQGSKKELAAYLGMTPATLSRAFRRLAPLGVRSRGSSIEIEDIARLHPTPASGAGAAAQD